MSEEVKENKTPTEYFEYIKSKKKTMDEKDLLNIYNNSIQLAEKYVITEQTKGLKKLIFYIETLEKEVEIVKAGINTFVYKEDMEYFIKNVANDRIKIIDMKSYEREIPDEVVDALADVKDKFNEFYILFTDYTGKVTAQIQQERKEKDPILFGAFRDVKSGELLDRFYYIADWEDEYCDLTLDKMVTAMKDKANINIENKISLPATVDDLKAKLGQLEEKESSYKVNNTKQRVGIFNKIRSFLSKK